MTSQALQHIEQRAVEVPRTLLDNQSWGLKTAGKIRPGMKVLSKAAEKNARARDAYADGMSKGQSFDEIEQAIVAAVPDLKNPLAMRNPPFFTVRRGDMTNPAIADQIMALYGEDRGDGVKRLYRFPVIFPADLWQLVVPHAMRCFTAGGLRYWSHYSRDGQERYCMTFAQPRTNASGRTVRLFGGRKHVRREDNGGLCDPENCHEYQTTQCNMDGRIIFWIPGIESLSPLEIPTRSYYGLSGIIAVLKDVAFARGGRISGFLGAQRQTFWITKRFDSVTHLDLASGKSKRVDQWIIRLDAPIDAARLLRDQDDDAVQFAGEQAARVLSVGEVASIEVGGECSANEPREVVDGELVDPDPPAAAEAGAPSVPAAPAAVPPASATDLRSAGAADPLAAARADLGALLSELAIEPALFERYATKKWGAGWLKNVNGIHKAVQLIGSHRAEPQALLHKMQQELEVFA